MGVAQRRFKTSIKIPYLATSKTKTYQGGERWKITIKEGGKSLLRKEKSNKKTR